MNLNYDLLPACVGIVGSRQWPDPDEMRDILHKFIKPFPKDTVIVSGGAKGVDTWAHDAAVAHRLAPPLDILVDREEVARYEKQGFNSKAAFAKAAYDRNLQIVLEVKRHDGILFAFVNARSESHGTDNTLEWCDKKNVPFIRFELNEENKWISQQSKTLALNDRFSRIVNPVRAKKK